MDEPAEANAVTRFFHSLLPSAFYMVSRAPSSTPLHPRRETQEQSSATGNNLLCYSHIIRHLSQLTTVQDLIFLSLSRSRHHLRRRRC